KRARGLLARRARAASRSVLAAACGPRAGPSGAVAGAVSACGAAGDAGAVGEGGKGRKELPLFASTPSCPSCLSRLCCPTPYDQPVRALIIEDDPTIADFVARGLRESGFAGDRAAAGEAGLSAALRDSYDV